MMYNKFADFYLDIEEVAAFAIEHKREFGESGGVFSAMETKEIESVTLFFRSGGVTQIKGKSAEEFADFVAEELFP